MPLLFSELGWVWEVLKLLGRFAPLADRLAPHAHPQLPPVTIDSLDAEIQEQLIALRGRLEAPMNDLRKQVQEQNLKLHQIEEELHTLQHELGSTLKLAREIKDEIAVLRLWLFVALGFSTITLILVLVLLLRH